MSNNIAAMTHISMEIEHIHFPKYLGLDKMAAVSDAISKCIFPIETVFIFIKISLQFITRVQLILKPQRFRL